jgi:hypothetical protein
MDVVVLEQEGDHRLKKGRATVQQLYITLQKKEKGIFGKLMKYFSYLKVGSHLRVDYLCDRPERGDDYANTSKLFTLVSSFITYDRKYSANIQQPELGI